MTPTPPLPPEDAALVSFVGRCDHTTGRVHAFALSNLLARVQEAERERDRWLAWSDGEYPDDSPGDVIAAYSDGTIILDDGITTWNPLRALAWMERRREDNAARLAAADPEASK